MIFFYKKESRFNPRFIHKSRFLVGKVPIEKIWVENSVFAIQDIENRKSFTEAYSCSFTFHTSYKNGMIGHGGGTQSKCSKHFSIKTF